MNLIRKLKFDLTLCSVVSSGEYYANVLRQCHARVRPVH